LTPNTVAHPASAIALAGLSLVRERPR
jgi:hypothetical protein